MPSVEEVGVHLKARNDLTKELRAAKAETIALARELEAAGGPRVSRSLGDLTGTVGGLHRQLQAVGTSSLRLTTSLGGLVETGVRRAGIGLGALAVTAEGFGIRSAASFEQSRIAMGTLLGDAERGNQIFAQLQQANLKTPFTLSNLTGATQTLLNFNVAGDDVLKTVTALGDLASTAQNPTDALDRIAFAYGQINSSARINAQDLNQLVQAGVPAYQVLAEAFGKSVSEIKRDIDNGLDLDPKVFLARLTSLDGVLANRRGAAEKQSLTLMGQASNLKDILSTRLASATQPLADDLRQNMPAITAQIGTLIDTTVPGLSHLFSDILGQAPATLERLGPPLSHLIDELDDMVTGGGGDALADLFVTLIGVLPGMVHVVGELVPVLGGVVDAFETIVSLPGGSEVLVGLFVASKLSPAISLVSDLGTAVGGLATKMWGLAAAEEAESVARSGGTISGRGKVAAAGGALAGAGLVYAGTRGNESVLGDAATIGGATLTGASIGSVIPGVGTAIGGAVGAAVGVGGVVGRRWAHSDDVPAPTYRNAAGQPVQVSRTTVLQSGAVAVVNPTSNVDVASAVQEGIRAHEEEQDRRGG